MRRAQGPWCQSGANAALKMLLSRWYHRHHTRQIGLPAPLSGKSRLVFLLIAPLVPNESSGSDGKDPDPHNDPRTLLDDDSDVHVLPVSRGSIDDPAARRSVCEDCITWAGSGPGLLTGRSSGNPDTTFPRPREMAGRYAEGRRRARAAVLLWLRCDDHRLYAGADGERSQKQAESTGLHELTPSRA